MMLIADADVHSTMIWTAVGAVAAALATVYGIRQQFLRWKSEIRRKAIEEHAEEEQEKADREKLAALDKIVKAMQDTTREATREQTRELKQDNRERGEAANKVAVKAAETLANKVAETATELATKVAKSAEELAHGVSTDLEKHKADVQQQFAKVNERLDKGNDRMDGMGKSIDKILQNGNGH